MRGRDYVGERDETQRNRSRRPPLDHGPPTRSTGGPAGRRGPAPEVVEVRPPAGPARLRARHRGLIASLFGLVVLPLAAAALYLWLVAGDQYASTTGFTVRQEERGAASDLIGGLAQFAGAGRGRSDPEVLYEFIRSQELVETIERDIGLVAHYARRWPGDPVFALWPDASIEDLLWFWQRVVRISFDQATGLIEVQVRAFDAPTAQRIATVILAESQAMINRLNETARRDAMRYARADLDEAIARLKTAREAMTAFRVRTQIVDPDADIQGRMGVLNSLQQQLATALVEHDLLLGTTDAGDPRRRQAERRIEVIRERIAEERRLFAAENIAAVNEDYPTLLAQYESLRVDLDFAEETYRAALVALDRARSDAARQSLYLATYIRPTLADEPEYPQRAVLFGLAALFLGLAWSIMALVYYSLRDRR